MPPIISRQPQKLLSYPLYVSLSSSFHSRLPRSTSILPFDGYKDPSDSSPVIEEIVPLDSPWSIVDYRSPRSSDSEHSPQSYSTSVSRHSPSALSSLLDTIFQTCSQSMYTDHDDSDANSFQTSAASSPVYPSFQSATNLPFSTNGLSGAPSDLSEPSRKRLRSSDSREYESPSGTGVVGYSPEQQHTPYSSAEPSPVETYSRDPPPAPPPPPQSIARPTLPPFAMLDTARGSMRESSSLYHGHGYDPTPYDSHHATNSMSTHGTSLLATGGTGGGQLGNWSTYRRPSVPPPPFPPPTTTTHQTYAGSADVSSNYSPQQTQNISSRYAQHAPPPHPDLGSVSAYPLPHGSYTRPNMNYQSASSADSQSNGNASSGTVTLASPPNSSPLSALPPSSGLPPHPHNQPLRPSFSRLHEQNVPHGYSQNNNNNPEPRPASPSTQCWNAYQSQVQPPLPTPPPIQSFSQVQPSQSSTTQDREDSRTEPKIALVAAAEGSDRESQSPPARRTRASKKRKCAMTTKGAGSDSEEEYTGEADDRARVVVAQKKRGKLPKHATDTLKKWLFAHREHAYPPEEVKKQLCAETGLTMSQVANWFINVSLFIASFSPTLWLTMQCTLLLSLVRFVSFRFVVDCRHDAVF